MKILMLSWEYPPYVVGGMGRHVAELVPALTRQGTTVQVVTPTFKREDMGRTVEDGIVVHRVYVPKKSVDCNIYDHIVESNLIIRDYIYQNGENYDLIHVHDWLTGFAAIDVHKRFGYPLVSTIHATERGRERGHLSNKLQRDIDTAEQNLAQISETVIVCSQYMSQEVQSFFNISANRLHVVPNGVNALKPEDRADKERLAEFRAKYAEQDELIIFTVARLVYQKGLHKLIDAVPTVMERFPNIKVVIAGKGPEAENLKQQAQDLGITNKIDFVGFVSDEEVRMFYQVASCAVFPSLYEPFGIVALEAMSIKCPVIVSEVGGLAEVVKHTETGVTTYPDDADSVAWGILHVLNNPALVQGYVVNARQSVEDLYSWSRVAYLTRDVYKKTLFSDDILTGQVEYIYKPAVYAV